MNPENNNAPLPTPRPMGEGGLVVRVTTARGAIPLEGAQVNIRSYAKEGEGRGDVLYALVSGTDGKTDLVRLPTVARTDSLSPGNGTPFLTYNIEVFLEGYYSQQYVNVPIFDGIIAVQPADMIPLPENGRTDSQPPDGERFFESFAPEL